MNRLHPPIGQAFLMWRKSSRSSSGGDPNCVEVAAHALGVAVRDSKLDTVGDFPVLSVSTRDWRSLTAALKADGFAQ